MSEEDTQILLKSVEQLESYARHHNSCPYGDKRCKRGNMDELCTCGLARTMKMIRNRRKRIENKPKSR